MVSVCVTAESAMPKSLLRLIVISVFVVSYAARSDDSVGVADTAPIEQTPTLSANDVDRLFPFGKIWGFLKYHHPRVSAGCFDWDSELINSAHPLLDASTDADANQLIVDWAHRLNSEQRECAEKNEGDIHIAPDTAWINDVELLSPELSSLLTTLREDNENAASQFYVELQPGVGNPQFYEEEPYSDLENPDWRYRLLAVFRFWNIVEYWFPYRDQISTDWDSVLEEFIPRLVQADSRESYVLELMALIAKTEDGHANLWSSIRQRPPAGEYQAPVQLRMVGDAPVVWRALDFGNIESSEPLRFGDEILSIDGKSIAELVQAWSPYYGASNRSALMHQIADTLLRGETETVSVVVNRNDTVVTLDVAREIPPKIVKKTHDRDGDTLQMLSRDIAYLKLSTVDNTLVSECLEAIEETKGLIIDIRNYPTSFMVFALGQHLVQEPTEFARFTRPILDTPGTFRWSDPILLQPEEPFYEGRVVILVDEQSLSQSEYTAMAFRAAPGAVIVGSQTAGADGNISRIPLPGGHYAAISGIGVFYPDKSPTQQIGIIPDIDVRPSIAGIRAGRDEVLEAAVQEILGDEVTASELRRMTQLPHALSR